ncbi:MAG: NAD(+)/NADH kinase [Clostridium sp.]
MKKVAIAINPSKDDTGSILKDIKRKLMKGFDLCDIKVINSFEVEKEDSLEDLELIVVLGGDGTILSVARKIVQKTNAPILGINIGNLGFLSSIEEHDIDAAIQEIKNSNYKLQSRMMLKAESTDKLSHNALNDVVISRGTLSRIVKFSVYIDGLEYASFKGDGLIVSTPTGSTAYSFSAGGPLIYPTLDVITLTPICPHTKSMEPIVIGGDSVIEIYAQNGNEEMYLTLDGQEAIKLDDGAKVTIKKEKKRVNIILFKDYDYFKVLRAKLLSNKF